MNEGETTRKKLETTLVTLFRIQIKQTVNVQHELITRLLDEEYELPLNLAETLEDAANRLLHLAEIVSRQAIKGPSTSNCE